MKVSKLKIKTKNKSYNVIVGSNIIKNLSKIFNDNSINFTIFIFFIFLHK